MFNPNRLETTINILRQRGLGVHADLVSQAQEEIRELQSKPLARTPLKQIIQEETPLSENDTVL